MANQFALIDSVVLLDEALAVNASIQEFAVAEVYLELPICGGADTIQVGGGGSDRGATTTDTLATMIQKTRRDGKTVTLKSAMLSKPGRQASTAFYTSALTVSGGNLTSTLTQVDEASVIAAAAGVHDNPIAILVRYKLT